MAFYQHPQPIDRVIATSEISALIHRYAYHGRENIDWELYSGTLHPEAQIHLANGQTLTVSQWRGFVQGPEMVDYIRHHVTTVDMDFNSETEAVARVQFFAITSWSSGDHWGQWNLVLARDEAGKWLIKEKTIVLEGTDPKGWAAHRYKLA